MPVWHRLLRRSTPIYPGHPRLRPYIYSLALGVYCTSWTFFGAVGTAVRDGWGYLPIYLGPALVFLFGLPLMERLVEIGRAHKVSSIADFIASRFGKSRALAVLVTVIALTAAIPYLALQYKAVAASIAVLTQVAAPQAVVSRHRPRRCAVDGAVRRAVRRAPGRCQRASRRPDVGDRLRVVVEAAGIRRGGRVCLPAPARPAVALAAAPGERRHAIQRRCREQHAAGRRGDFLSAPSVSGGRRRVREYRRSEICALAAAGLSRPVLGIRRAGGGVGDDQRLIHANGVGYPDTDVADELWAAMADRACLPGRPVRGHRHGGCCQHCAVDDDFQRHRRAACCGGSGWRPARVSGAACCGCGARSS